MKLKFVVLGVLTLMYASQSSSICTTVLVGKKASPDGSLLMARSEDYDSTNAKHFVMHPHVENQKGTFKSNGNKFTYPLAETQLRYTSLSDYDTNDKSMGEVGFNELGVGLTATETIVNSERVLKIDPYVEKTGINEDSIQNVVLPRMKSAREGVEILGKIIQEKGAAEGFGVGFMDNKEIWYLETGSGHQWAAVKLPDDVYFVSANQGRLNKIDLKDSVNYLGSPTLVAFAQKNGLYNPKEGEFDFHKAYVGETDHDKMYNYPRVWALQHIFSPAVKYGVLEVPEKAPVFLKPAKPMGVPELARAMRHHYQGSGHDPYAKKDPSSFYGDSSKYYRPVAVFRTQESHVMQIRPNMPPEIGSVVYIAMGMSVASAYVPYFQGLDKVPVGFDKGNNNADEDSVTWKYRKLQTLVMMNFKEYAPIVQKAYAGFEKKRAKEQSAMEKQYMGLYKQQPDKAKAVLVAYQDKVHQEALDLTEILKNQIFTLLTVATDKKYQFAGE